MGGTQIGSSSTISILNDGQPWKLYKQTKGIYSSRWINTITGDISAQHFLSYNDEVQSQRDIKIYDYRKNSPNFIRAFYFEVLRDQIVCYTTIRCRVLLEVIRYKLQSIKLQGLEIYYVFLECLLGFQQLYNKFGYVEIDKDMIGINNQGKIKLWLNKNYAMNNKQEDSGIINEGLLRRKKNPQTYMIRKIIKIINKQSTTTQILQSEFLVQENKSDNHDSNKEGFKEVINHFNNIIRRKDYTLPKKITTVHQNQQLLAKNNQSNNIIQRRKLDFSNSKQSQERSSFIRPAIYTIPSVQSTISLPRKLDLHRQNTEKQGRDKSLKIVVEETSQSEVIAKGKSNYYGNNNWTRNNILSTKSSGGEKPPQLMLFRNNNFL